MGERGIEAFLCHLAQSAAALIGDDVVINIEPYQTDGISASVPRVRRRRDETDRVTVEAFCYLSHLTRKKQTHHYGNEEGPEHFREESFSLSSNGGRAKKLDIL